MKLTTTDQKEIKFNSLFRSLSTGNQIYDNRRDQYLKFCQRNKLEIGLESIKKYISESKTVSTASGRKVALLAVLRRALELAPNPQLESEIDRFFKSIKTGKKQSIAINPSDCFSDSEIDQIISSLLAQPTSKKYNTDPDRYRKFALIVWTLYNTGLRISELLGIRLDRIHLNGIAKITVTGKGKKERTIFLPREKVEEIKSLFKSKTYLFENNKNKQYDRVNLTKLLKKEIKKIFPKKDFRAHLLRHSFATNQIVGKKKSVKSISNYLGHSSTAITQDLYLHDNLEYSDLFDK